MTAAHNKLTMADGSFSADVKFEGAQFVGNASANMSFLVFAWR